MEAPIPRGLLLNELPGTGSGQGGRTATERPERYIFEKLADKFYNQDQLRFICVLKSYTRGSKKKKPYIHIFQFQHESTASNINNYSCGQTFMQINVFKLLTTTVYFKKLR